MAKRYSRQISLEMCDESEMETLVGDFDTRMGELIDYYFPGWKIINNNISIQIIKGNFQGELETEKTVDLVDGIDRKHFLYISAGCTNTKRKEGRESALSMQHNMAAVFGLIGGVAFAVIWLLIEILLFRRIHVLMAIFMFSLGAAIVGGVGALLGKEIGSKMKSKISESSLEEESLYQESSEKWESFIDVLVEEVHSFASNVESTRSRATIV